jgi:hypothetical protein
MLNGTVVRPGSGIKYNPGTVVAYERALRVDVVPHIGAIPVVKLTRWTIQQLVDDLAAHRSAEIACKAFGALRGVLGMCIETMYACDSLGANNPCKGVILPAPARIVEEYGVTTPKNTGGLALKARAAAVDSLINNHKGEYDALIVTERTKRGLTPHPITNSDVGKIEWYEARIEWLKAKMVAEQAGKP